MKSLLSLVYLVVTGWCAAAEPVSLFDGKSLTGWSVRAGEEKWWSVKDGMITGGSLEQPVPFNTFLSSEKPYQNFDLTFKIRLVKGDGFINSGLQVRSKRVKDSGEMSGYQIDAGIGYWGDIYDESRRNTAVVKPKDREAVSRAVKDWDWNEYRILCEGRRIKTWINGFLVHDYTEPDSMIPQDGIFGLQAHSGGKFLVQMKDVFITELPETPGIAKWDVAKIPSPRTGEQQRAGFILPEGFQAELVASEVEGVGKPITVTWDQQGRMWTMTALEYPVDANENVDAANALFARGGKDRVLVFDDPNATGPQTPRLFAEGLAIPLGVLPYKKGALVQYGKEIRYYVDQDGDGKADEHSAILEGFGIQDSHLFPHQFERSPGGWIYVAQGAFNRSNVKRPGGLKFESGVDEVVYNQCRLARFRPDGSDFEIIGAGLHNIWGISLARTGETFVQEANDMGYPVTEFAIGTVYPGSTGGKLRDDAPTMPQSTNGNLMGGTGLSGLAMAEDLDSPFAAAYGNASVFYVVNPITQKIQVVTMTRDETGHPVYEKQDDFMLSDDPWFRPVAAHFGPDGCLYITDWYNKIISHNEVPRTHPDRDKSHGRIWRIRHVSQKSVAKIDLTKLSDDGLLEYLGGASARTAALAWQAIVDRKATGLAPKLEVLIGNQKASLPSRLGAVWALEGLGAFPPNRLLEMAKSMDSEMRFEAIRIAGELSLPEAEFVGVTSALKDDPNFRVRAAIANAVRGHRNATPEIAKAAARLGLEPMEKGDRASYDRAFERYLARWAMAVHPEATEKMLASSEDLELEAKLLAVRSFPNQKAALEMLKFLPQIKRSLTTDELALLGGQINQPAVLTTLGVLLDSADQRESLLLAMTQLDRKLAANPELSKVVGTGLQKLLADGRTPVREKLVMDLARRFRVSDLQGEVKAWTMQPVRTGAELAEGLGALREIGLRDLAFFRAYLDHSDDAVKREAVTGFGAIDSPEVVAEYTNRWPNFSGALRNLAVDGMTSSTGKAKVFAEGLSQGKFAGFDPSAVEKLIAILGANDPAVVSVMKSGSVPLKPVIVQDGSPKARVVTEVNLDGAFTLEGWINLDPKIDGNDNLFGRPGGPDINFFDGRLRVYGGPGIGDLITAQRVMRAGEWTHCAITRSTSGKFKIYLDGELDQENSREFSEPLTGLNLGDSTPQGGSSAKYDEFRIWNIERSGEEIRRDYRTSYAGGPVPTGLVKRIAGDLSDLKLEGGAKISVTRDFPEMITVEQSKDLASKFDRFRKMTEKPGDPAKGKALMTATCLICHRVGDEGLAIGPNLSGAGAMGIEALLRNILTPNAQLESGYYRHDIKLRDGSFLSGFLVSESTDSLTLRQIGTDERVISRTEIETHDISKRSLMPEGLIDGYSEQQVADLFSYLSGLK